MERLRIVATSLLLFVSSASAQQEATFQGLGNLGGEFPGSLATAASTDGAVVVGKTSTTDGTEPFRWEAGTMVPLGSLPGGAVSARADGVSADGSVVVGLSNSANGPQEAYRWTEAGGMEGLGDLAGGSFNSAANDVSADGSAVVGQAVSANGIEAFMWTVAGGMAGLGDLEGGGFNSTAYGISSDGEVVVGRGAAEGGTEAFRWENGVMVGLGVLPGELHSSQANAASADGSVVVGSSTSEPGSQAFRWTEADGMISLGDLPGGGFFSSASDVSADGGVVVGYSAVDGGTDAFIWAEEEGMRSLKVVLETVYGLDLTGWELNGALGISDDGTVIVGYGNNPDDVQEAWRAFLPPSGGATTRYVDGAAGTDAGDCADEGNPCATISYALGQANPADTLDVADAEYTETLTINMSLTLRGESTAGTIIQAHEIPGEATSRVITIEGDVEVEIKGVTVRHGVAPGNAPSGLGGGIYVKDGNLTLTNVVVTENAANQNGGGLRIDSNASCTLANVVFSENTASSGAGMLNSADGCTLTNVVFIGNAAGSTGGGMFNSFTPTSPTLTNVTFYGNSADLIGGGMYNTESAPTLVNSIVWGNTAGFNANEIYNSSGASIGLHFSLYGDEEGDIEEGGGFDAQNSLTEDPIFADAENGDLSLQDVSPAVDAGDPATDLGIFPTDENGDPLDLAGNPRVFNDMIDIGAYENQGSIANEPPPNGIADVLGYPSPNPAFVSTSLRLRVSETQEVVVRLYDALGRLVAVVHDDELAAGQVLRLGIDVATLAAGAYVAHVEGETFSETRHITVVR